VQSGSSSRRRLRQRGSPARHPTACSLIDDRNRFVIGRSEKIEGQK
jgi:hypothetical protein